MFELKWGRSDLVASKHDFEVRRSQVRRKDIASMVALRWEEHCVECAIPECYQTCLLYRKREDGACARFAYGIAANKTFKGHYNFGADIQFRRWGKLEASLKDAYQAYTMTVFDRLININWIRRAGLSWGTGRNRRQGATALKFDEFVIECYSFSPTPFRIICEYFTESNRIRTTKFRQNFLVNGGYNFFTVPFQKIKIEALEGYIYLYPEESNVEKRIVFTWADIVKYRKNDMVGSKSGTEHQNSKVKCVAWDLDNTFWRGTLSEESRLSVNEDAIKLVKALDQRGIIQTVVSKNDFGPAWNQLEKIGMDQYFIAPAINWERKSENLVKIAGLLNIGIDTIAVIDDSEFEREEIRSVLPCVKVYSEKEINKILLYEEFDPLTSNEGKERRIRYKEEILRAKQMNDFGGSYDEFLASCNMQAEVFIPFTEDEVERCLELIQRSNQLNLSGNRYSRSEFTELLKSERILAVAIRCKDRFGEYGIIGFASVDLAAAEPALLDLVLSCRVAQKKVEHNFLKHLAGYLLNLGYSNLSARLKHTPKNGPLKKVFDDLPFAVAEQSEEWTLLKLNLGSAAEIKNSMTVVFKIAGNPENVY